MARSAVARDPDEDQLTKHYPCSVPQDIKFMELV